MWNSKNVFLNKAETPSETHNLLTVFMRTLNVNKVWQVRVFRKSSITQTREKWDSHVLSISDFWIVWRRMWLSLFLFFLFRSNVTKWYLDESDFRNCYGSFFESAIPKVTWSQLCWSFLSTLTLTTAFWRTYYDWRFYGHGSRYVLILSSKP